MENEKIEQLQKQFSKVYLDTTKHCQDIEKWIKSGNRKQGDIRRSLNRLTKKYENLCEIKTELRKNNISEQDVLNHSFTDNNTFDLVQMKVKIENLYSLVGLRRTINPMYNVDLVEEITSKPNMESSQQKESKYDDSGFIFNIPPEGEGELRKQTKYVQDDSGFIFNIPPEGAGELRKQTKYVQDDSGFIFNIPPEGEIEPSKRICDNVDLVSDIQNSEEGTMSLFSLEEPKEKSLIIKIKQKLGKIKEKIKNKVSDFKDSKKKNAKPKGRLAKRIAALGMALTMGLFSSATAGENISKSDDARNNKSYTDANHEKNTFKDSIYIQVLENTEATKTTVDAIENTKNTEIVQELTESSEKNKEEQENKKVTEDDKEERFLARANTKYTGVSDGSGNSGYFAKDTKVKVYNRALIKTCKDGSKEILKATKVGQTWKQFTEEKGIDYEEFKAYIENNENIQECVSIQSEDGKTLYGWLSIGELERIEVENMEEIER